MSLFRLMLLCGCFSAAVPDSRAEVVVCGDPQSGYCCTSGQYHFAPCGPFSGEPVTFETTHSWKVIKPGTMKLSGTAFQIVLDETRLSYQLRWRDSEIGTFLELRTAKEQGVAKARSLQEIGAALE